MNSTLRALGYAGLVPFAGLPMLVSPLGWLSTDQGVPLFTFYSCLILGFMAGVLWPVLYSTDSPGKLGLFAVSIPVFAFLVLWWWPQLALLVLALLFLLLRGGELWLGVDRRYSVTYRSLRWQLTLMAVAGHLWLYWLI